MKKLYCYDKEQNTNYCEILYTYLISERNITKAAEILYMHRNTVIYKLKKIKTLVDVNLDDYLERQHIILSYEVLSENMQEP